jgi:hypothetical protein
MNEFLLLLISGFIFTVYVGSITVMYGVQKSISASYYVLPVKLRPVFTFVLWGFAGLLFFVSESVLLKLAVGGICFVGAASDYNSSDLEEKVHVYSAIAGSLLGLLAIWIELHLWYIPASAAILCGFVWLIEKRRIDKWKTSKSNSFFSPIIAYSVKEKAVNNKIWYWEVIAYYSVWFGLFINLY